jgi:hypothetical protein
MSNAGNVIHGSIVGLQELSGSVDQVSHAGFDSVLEGQIAAWNPSLESYVVEHGAHG